MKRFQLFELEDFEWFPDVIREGETDYLRFCIELFNIYKPSIELLKDLINKTGNTRIIDLCSGGGGAYLKAAEEIPGIKIILTDKFPNVPAFRYLKQKTNGRIDFDLRSIDAANVPDDLIGIRTIFSAFHHFPPDIAKKILKDAVDKKQAIGIFEGGERSILDIIAVIITSPVFFFFFTPFIKPFKITRLLFTYIIPFIPLATMWDGIVSMLRMYKPNELLELAGKADVNNLYEWKSDKIKSGQGKNIYLIGYPKN